MRLAWAVIVGGSLGAAAACSGSATSDCEGEACTAPPPPREGGPDAPAPPPPPPDPPVDSGVHGALLFAQSYGGADEEFEDGIAADPSGGLGLVGSAKSSFDFGSGMLVNAGGADAFVAKLDKDGKTLAARFFGDASDQFGTSIAINGAGETFALVLYHGTVDWGGIQDVANADGAFDLSLGRLRIDLSFANRAYLGGAGPQNGFSVFADPAAGAYVAGQNGGSMSVAGAPLTATEVNDGFAAHVLSSQDWGAPLADPAPGMDVKGIAFDASGSAYVTGSFTGTMDLGGGPVTSAGGADIFVEKLDAAGKHVKTARFGGASDDRAQRIAVDKSGRIVLAGWYTGSSSLGTATVTSKGAEDVFVLALDASLAPLQTLTFGSAANDEATGLAIDASGGILLTGNTFGMIDFGGGPLPNAGMADIFVAKLRSDGAHVWSRTMGDAGDQRSYYGAAISTTGDVWITGHFTGSMDVGGKTLTSAGLHDVFLAKYSP
ncbi:MAG TPA: hypothetical protein VIF62_05785 [Labilithrix sp.]